MSPRKQFDRFMVDVRNGTNFKLATLSHVEYRALFSAVLPIAAVSDVRGAFMVSGEPAGVEHMRIMAPTLTVAECRRALGALRGAGILEQDDELGGEWVHDFEDYNPAPRPDRTNGERQKRYRQKQKALRNDVTNGPRNGKVTQGEVEVEVHPPSPPKGNPDFEEWLLDHESVTSHKPPKPGTAARKALAESFDARRAEGYSMDDLKDATIGAHQDEYRREHGYNIAESVLRPTKIAGLIAKGRMRKASRRSTDTAALAAAHRASTP